MLTATNEASYPNPLPWAEVAGIARSIERYRRQWIASGWAHRPAWLERQRARGQRGGKVSGCRRRARAAQLRAEGMTAPAIAEELEVGESTVWRYLASIPSHEANTVNAPPGPMNAVRGVHEYAADGGGLGR